MPDEQPSSPKPNLRWWVLAILGASLTAWTWYRAGEVVAWCAGVIALALTVRAFLGAQKPFFPIGLRITVVLLAIIAVPYASWRLWQYKESRHRAAELDQLQSKSNMIHEAGGQYMGHDVRRIQFVGSTATNHSLSAVSSLKSTEWLSLHTTGIDDDGLAAISDWHNLKYLSLAYGPVTDAGLVHIVDLDTLETLELWSNGITNAGLRQLESLSSLKKLHIQSDNVTAAGIQGLQKALPGCKIVAEPMPLASPITPPQGPKSSNSNAGP